MRENRIDRMSSCRVFAIRTDDAMADDEFPPTREAMLALMVDRLRAKEARGDDHADADPERAAAARLRAYTANLWRSK